MADTSIERKLQGERLQAWRRSLTPKTSQEEMAERLSLGRVTYASYEQGTRRIPASVLTSLRAFGYDSETEGNAAIVREPRSTAGYSSRAVVRSWRGAMAGLEDDDGTMESDGTQTISTAFMKEGAAPERHDIVRVSGRSMEPRIRSGDEVYIYRDTVLIPNSIVLASAPDDRVFLKVLREGASGRWELHSIGSSGSVFRDLTGWRIHGYAITIKRANVAEGEANYEFLDGKPLRA